MSVDLEKLKVDIEALGENIKTLKSAGGDKDAIAKAVQDLLDAKKKYADNNNGIGVDGKPYEEPLTKAQKKAKAKAEKSAGPAKQEKDPNSKNAQEKAAKKAAAKAKKEAMKAGGGGGGAPKGAPAPAPAAAAAEGAKPPAAAAAAAPKAAPSTTPVIPAGGLSTGGNLQPLQLSINPNVPLIDRPIVALAAGVISNTIVDYNIISDHKIRQSALCTSNGNVIVGDFAIARYIVKNSTNKDLLCSTTADDEGLVDSWIDYSSSLMKLAMKDRIQAIIMTLEYNLSNATYLVNNTLTMADICLFAALGFPSQIDDYKQLQVQITESGIANTDATYRWINMLRSNPSIKEATQLAMGIANNFEAIFNENEVMEPLVSGMSLLEGGIVGKVCTRFPPEPSGYLHIGHAKAVLLNDYYATRYKGKLILRFDDTNPTKEKEEYQQSIVEDLAALGVKPTIVTYTSDYFHVIKNYAEHLIKNGLAFMDDTPQEVMKEERMERKESKNRSQSVEDALKYFNLMCSGSKEGAPYCLRAKIDMSSVNGTMRDPVLFRQNTTPHHRSGTTYKAYPTYDLACPIVDSLEGVTHALRTTEYNDRDEQYAWIQKALNLRRVRIHAFSRMNFTHTVLSKRKLTWFVENKHVSGWDDARFPTIRGVVRRGINITALRNFMLSQGASRRVVNMVWNTFWAENKKEIDKTAKRYMSIDKDRNFELSIVDNTAPSENDNGFVMTTVHPKDPSLGKRVIRLSNKVLLEESDVDGIQANEEIVLLRWGVVKILKVDMAGKKLEGTYIPNGDFKAAKRKLSWIADVANNTPVILTEFDNLILKEKLEEEDKFEDHINPNTLATTEVIGDAGLKTLQTDQIIQLERRGYYRVDRPYIGPDKPLILYMIPDGKTKAMAGLTGKLAHH